MFCGQDEVVLQILEEWTEMMNDHFVSFTESLDIVVKYTSLLFSTSSTALIEPLTKFFDDLFFILIDKKYLLFEFLISSSFLSDIELSILMSAFVEKSGSDDFKIRTAIKGFYQSIVACANRDKVRLVGWLDT